MTTIRLAPPCLKRPRATAACPKRLCSEEDRRRFVDPLSFQWADFDPRSARAARGQRREPKKEAAEAPVDGAALAVEYVRNGRRDFEVKNVAADADRGGRSRKKKELVVVERRQENTLGGRLRERIMRYFLPVGYPSSVGPDYSEYTRWRLSAFFWGGCVGVFSTQGLLLAVGVGRQSAVPLAAALQWVIRDGVGRAGRMIFSQIGTGFDAETKQHRLAAALVLNMSCTLESITPALPRFFLPLACAANLAKGASTVASASTRGAIYRSFMRRENLGDITAKQETVGVAGDLAGTALGIALSRMTAHSSVLTSATFALVSAAHLFSVYREVKGLRLTTLNRQRAHMLIKRYISSGQVPPPALANRKERVVYKPWLDSLHAPNIELGARLQECAPDAEALQYLVSMYRRERYILTYEQERVRVVLRRDASSQDCLKAFLQAGHFWKAYSERGRRDGRNRDILEESYKFVHRNFSKFVASAKHKEWNTDSVLLRPIGRRVLWGNLLPP